MEPIEPENQVTPQQTKTLRWGLFTEENETFPSAPGDILGHFADLVFLADFLTRGIYLQKWRTKGNKVILAQYDADSIVVYQCYNSTIASYAVEHKKFAGCPGFNETRMTWVKSNFLWAMYRSGWAKKSNQDHILAIWLKREAFEDMCRASKHSSEQEREEATKNGTRTIVSKSPNRIQWDPQHAPDGSSLRQRALQLGVKDPRYVSGEWIVDIQDITPQVIQQRPLAIKKPYPWHGLMVPIEDVYEITDATLAKHLALDSAQST